MRWGLNLDLADPELVAFKSEMQTYGKVAASHLTKDRHCSHETAHVCLDAQQGHPNLA